VTCLDGYRGNNNLSLHESLARGGRDTRRFWACSIAIRGLLVVLAVGRGQDSSSPHWALLPVVFVRVVCALRSFEKIGQSLVVVTDSRHVCMGVVYGYPLLRAGFKPRGSGGRGRVGVIALDPSKGRRCSRYPRRGECFPKGTGRVGCLGDSRPGAVVQTPLPVRGVRDSRRWRGFFDEDIASANRDTA
jgi:hypothetical protein